MTVHTKAILLGLMLTINSAHADDSVPSGVNHESRGFAAGTLIGGLIGGPVGAVIGAAGGSVIGNQHARQQQISALEYRLRQRDIELAQIQSEFIQLKDQHARSLRKVALEHHEAHLNSWLMALNSPFISNLTRLP
ncbi:MAG: hypothetical protein MI673_00705 [Thiotrichales bacterium]|nr:hypothetical protein [Thiotrichales bacterium]